MDNSAQRPTENGESSSVSAAMSKTTTISTIAVQSGKTRIVIALLHVRFVFLHNIRKQIGMRANETSLGSLGKRKRSWHSNCDTKCR